ncbi:hypothetical protein [Pseudomonas sp. NA-150]|uniref:hypothetical protein n=1 Tax=Pseudomonas sp. NA-150 TaxID=3367525 RepID=UPI0037CBC9A5
MLSQHLRRRRLSIIQRVWFLPLFAVIGTLCWVATAQQSPAGNSGYRSTTHFLLVGEMPANTVLRSTAQYDPMPGQQNCPHHRPQLHMDTQPDSAVQPFSFEVPLAWHLPGCTLVLSDVDFVTDGFYDGDKKKRSSTTSGAIAVRETLQKGVPGFPESGEKEYRGLCRWQRLVGPDGGKQQPFLTCHAADKRWGLIGDQPHRPGGAVSRNELAGKTIRMSFKMADES